MKAATQGVRRARTPAEIRAHAAQLVAQVADHGRSLDALLSASSDQDGAERGLTRTLVYGTVRWHSRLLVVLGKLSARAPQTLDSELRALVLVGLYQLLHTDIAAHASVSETVEATRALKQQKAAGFVNAILRRCQREGVTIGAEVDCDPAIRAAHPPWLVRRLQVDWQERHTSILDANNAHPPMWLRVNPRVDLNSYLQQLRATGLDAERSECAPQALRLVDPTDVRKLPGFSEGTVSVQDAAAQLAASLLNAQPGNRVLDACAAPGGKTCHILELQPKVEELVALDVSAARLRKVEENLARLRLQATLRVGDATTPDEWWDGRPWQRILLDAPCSATGVIRRHPDIKLLRRPEDLETLARQQARMLESLWPSVAPGGRLLYASCSALRVENADIVSAFLASHPDARDATLAALSAHLPGCGGLKAEVGQRQPGLAIPAGEAQMDGFYYACLDKADL